MNITHARWADAARTIVAVETERGEMFVGDDPGNADRVRLAGWEAAGNRIADYIAPAPLVPQQIALWQARAILARKGLLQSADAAVAETGNAALTAVWEYGNSMSRRSSGLVALAAALGLDAAHVDALFIEAASIEV